MKLAWFRHKILAVSSSIRWRLPLSYAGIALLTAAALSGLLLFTLSTYYNQKEREYLDVSSRSLARQMGPMYDDVLAAGDMESTAHMLSFLAQARVQVLDQDMQVIADSGPVAEQTQVNVNFLRENWPRPPEAAAGGVSTGPYLSLDRKPEDPPPADSMTIYEEPPNYPFFVRRGPFGQLMADQDLSGERSGEQVTTPINGPDGEPLAYLKLSEGPAFGNEIVGDVAEKGAVAGLIAVLIAALAGIMVSRTISRPVLALSDATRQMAHGDLTVRVALKRRDEFGLLANTFNTMAQRVETTVNTLRQFVADAAHEINTPLTALRTNLELMTIHELPGTAGADIDQALTELTRLERLTRSLLTLAWLEAPAAPLHHDPVDLTALARHMHERYASRAEQAAINLIVDLPAEPVMVEANTEQITRVFDNLLDNALKFTPQNGHVTLGLRAEDGMARLWVHDTGIGIPEADLPKLFHRFHRGRNAAAFPGNGLGLVITKAIVTEHKGHIEVTSGDGTCFTVVLPRLENEPS